MKTDGIILDIDGTIWNTTPVVAEAWNSAIADCGYTLPTVTAERLQKEFGKPMDKIAESMWPQLSKEQQDTLIAACCVREHQFIENNTADITYPGVISTIRSMTEAGFTFYIVSNCQAGYIELTMEKNGITGCIRDFESYGSSGKYKAQNISDVVARNHITSPVYVGDTQGDLEACREAGVPFLFASWGFGAAAAEDCAAVLKSFDELPHLLERQ